MRPIEFRGKRNDNGAWVYGNLIIDEGQYYISYGLHLETYEVIPESVGQFTGLYDATKWEELTEKEQKAWLATGKTKGEWNGKKIYEGDVVKSTRYIGGNYLEYLIDFYEVIFAGVSFSYKPIKFGCLYTISMITNIEKIIKVIGNIYDNPELLEVK